MTSHPPADFAARLKGAWTALITPFRDGAVDERALRDLVEAQIAAGIDGLVPAGTTGESPTLDPTEHIQVIRIVVEAAKRRVPVLAGTGANATSEALHLSKAAAEAGADALLVVAPHYNRPSQQGLLLHYQVLLDSVDLPLVMYNIPGRTGVNVEPETMAALRTSARFVGVKESAGQPDQVSRIVELCGPGFRVMSGDDSLTLPFMAVGAVGVISVLSNLLPGEVAKLCRLFTEGKVAEARQLHAALFPLTKALFVETNPVPVKTALALLGRCEAFVRPPLAALEPVNLEKLKFAMRGAGLLV